MKEFKLTNLDLISDQKSSVAAEHDSQKDEPSKVIEITQQVGAQLIRYGLVIVIAWIGAMKFTVYEANGIQPLIANSPLMSWIYSMFSVTGTAALLGSVELVIATMMALYPVSRKTAAIGSGLAILLFLTTLSFLFSTPGWEPTLGGFPALSIVPGQFLIKDIVLLGGSIWSLGEAIKK